MQDAVVLQSLREKGIPITMENLLPYEAMERKGRVLDKPPKRIKLQNLPERNVYGIRNEFIMRFNDLKSTLTAEVTRIDLRGNTRICDKEVFIALQALIAEGVCYSEEKAQACFELFHTIVMAPGEMLSKSVVFEELNDYKPRDYCAKELLSAIKSCLFNVVGPVLYWINLCNLTGFYPKAVELGKQVIAEKCKTEKEVKDFLTPLYKEARANKSFMKDIYQSGANKWLIAMLWYLHEEHPEVMNPSTGKDDGFM